MRVVLRNSRRVHGLGKKPGIGILGLMSDLHLWVPLEGVLAPGWEHQQGLDCVAPTVEEALGRSWGIPAWNDPAAFLGSPPRVRGAPNPWDLCLELGWELGKALGSV